MNSWEEMIRDGFTVQDMQEKIAVKQLEIDSCELAVLIKTILTNSYIEKTYKQRKEG